MSRRFPVGRARPADQSGWELPPSERHFAHTVAVFSVSAGMIGVCLTSIGLVRIVSSIRSVESLCEELLVVDALAFGLAAWRGFRAMNQHIRRGRPLGDRFMDWTFGLALALMVIICMVFAWSLA